jgi:ribosome-associated protein
MDIRKLQRAIVDGLEDVKAQNISVFDTEHLSPLFERVIIASGTSNRQTKSLASSVRDAVRSRGMQVLRVEGEENGEWIIVDCGAAVVHIMQPVIRDYYHLEELWGEKPVRLKTAGAATKGLVKAASAADDDVDEAPAKRAPRKTTAAKSTAAKSAPAKGGAAKTAGVSKTAGATKTAVGRGPAAKSAAGRSTVAKKAAAPTTVERGSDKRAAKTTAKSFASGPAKKPASHTRPARGAVPTRVTASTPTRSNRDTAKKVAKKAAKTAGQAAAKKAPAKKASGAKSAVKKS